MASTHTRVIPGLVPGEKYVIRAREINENNVGLEWTDSILLDVPATSSNGVPGAVSSISVIPGIKILYLTFDANPENDLAGYNLYVGNTTGFTADATTLIKEVAPLTLTAVAQYYDTAGGGTLEDMVSSTVEVPVTYYVQIRARNHFGELSSAVEVSGSPGLVDNNTIEELTIDKLRTGVLTAAISLTSGDIRTADSGARFEINGSEIVAYRSTGSTPWFDLDVATESLIYTATDGSTLEFSAAGGIQMTDGTDTIVSITASGATFSGDISGASGTFTGGIEASSIDIESAVPANAWHMDTAGRQWWGDAASYTAAGTANAPRISNTGVIDNFQSSTFTGSITGATGTFTGSLTGATGAFAGTVTANNITAGGTITGSTLRTAVGGQSRVEITTGNVINFYENSTLTGTIDGFSDAGNPFFTSRNHKDIGLKSHGNGAVFIEASTGSGAVHITDQAQATSTFNASFGEAFGAASNTFEGFNSFPATSPGALSVGTDLQITLGDAGGSSGAIYYIASSRRFKDRERLFNPLSHVEVLPKIGKLYNWVGNGRLSTTGLDPIEEFSAIAEDLAELSPHLAKWGRFDPDNPLEFTSDVTVEPEPRDLNVRGMLVALWDRVSDIEKSLLA